jgi:phosphoglycerol transferase MdoB-like AlkP superfamily enzyme
MFSKLRFIFLNLLAWLVFFELVRMIFLLYHLTETSQLSSRTIFLTFVYGFRMDISMVSYLLIPVCLFVILSVVVPFFRRSLVYKIYNGVMLFVCSLITIVDLEIYNEWGYRLDSTIFQYLGNAKEATASVSHLPLFRILLVFLIVFLLLLYAFNKLVDRSIQLLEPSKEFILLSPLVVGALIALLIIPIRGGLQMQPLNQSWVYFSTNNYANVTALNEPWNFFQDVLDKQRPKNNPFLFFSGKRSEAIVDSLYASSHAHMQFVDTSAGKPNVILVIWESFTAKASWASINGQEVTPNFNRLKKEGIFFSNVYASGDRTHKGMSAVLSGYPALPTISIIRYPSKSAKLTLLSDVLGQHGYKSSFYYGGDPDYDNYKSYLLHGGFEITARDAFDDKDKITGWGAHDGAVSKKMIEDFGKWKQPFFSCWLTLSSHTPMVVPADPVFKGNDFTTSFYNALHYSDAVFNSFVEECKKQPWWKNTILIVVADHGHKYPRTGKDIDDFKIPLLWIGGAVEKNKGMVIDKVMSQLDIAATLTRQLGWNASVFPFSRDVTDSTDHPFAFFSNSTSFGLVQPDNYFLFDHLGKRISEQGGSVNQNDIEAGKAMQQFIYEDYLKK